MRARTCGKPAVTAQTAMVPKINKNGLCSVNKFIMAAVNIIVRMNMRMWMRSEHVFACYLPERTLGLATSSGVAENIL